jgi:hypothetical protein
MADWTIGLVTRSRATCMAAEPMASVGIWIILNIPSQGVSPVFT